MFNLHVIQANDGDCFILEFGTKEEPKYILIDGGPKDVYEDYLSNVLAEIKKKADKLELIILSHIDNDHILGLVDLLEERYFDKKEGLNEIINFEDIWFNSFRDAYKIDEDDEIEIIQCINNINRVLEKEIANRTRGPESGNKLSELTIEKRLNLNVNKHFNYKAVTLENRSLPIKFANLELTLIGPSNASLDRQRKLWLKWMKDKCLKLKVRAVPKEDVLEADKSKPNLSSIMILAIVADKKILLTGDGFRDHIIEGLKQNNLLKEGGTLFVDVLKVPHHGSDKNVSPKFFDVVRAHKYVISGDHSHKNPELRTLEWIVEAAKKQKREIEIYFTNKTPYVECLQRIYPPEKYGYKLFIMDESDPSMVINLLN